MDTLDWTILYLVPAVPDLVREYGEGSKSDGRVGVFVKEKIEKG